MSNRRIALRYAEAFLKEAQGQNILEKTGNDLALIQDIIKSSHDFLVFLKSPVIKKEKKLDVFRAAFGGSVQPLTLTFLSLLLEKERESELPGIIEVFFELQKEAMGIMSVNVKAAAELTEKQSEQLKHKFEGYLNKQVQINVTLDPALIGGFIARVGDTMYDGSVKHQLEVLRERFIEEHII